MMDIWTRVTSYLFIIHMEREQGERYPDVFGLSLKFALEKGLAKEAEEKNVE